MQRENEQNVDFLQRIALPAIRQAKAAVTAYFLSLEPAAQSSGLRPYCEFIEEILPMCDGPSVLSKSKKRVLSFNYDRLFELAFAKRFQRRNSSDSFGLHGPRYLNSGFTLDNGRMHVEPGKFSLLKMHGSVGHVARSLFGQGNEVEFSLKPLNSIPPDHLWDKEVGRKMRNGDIEPSDSLIHFPIEKAEFLGQLSGKEPSDNDRRAYITDIWRSAEAMMSSASKVYLMGFSARGKDNAYLEQLLKSAVNLDIITIYDPDAKNIEIRMKRMLPNFKGKLESHPCSFWT